VLSAMMAMADISAVMWAVTSAVTLAVDGNG